MTTVEQCIGLLITYLEAVRWACLLMAMAPLVGACMNCHEMQVREDTQGDEGWE